MLRFIHTSDWQIGRTYKGMPEDLRGLLRDARHEAVRNIGKRATELGINLILVAGDVYDIEEPSDITLNKPVEIMRSFGSIHWHLIPGNHDSARSGGLWSRLLERGLPGNVHVHLTPEIADLGDNAWLLPSPLPRRRTPTDLTEWMTGAQTPDGAFRIGIAHGGVVGFGGEGEIVDNLVPPNRPSISKLDYLAMGDWHTERRIGPRICYAGTPETDRWKSQAGTSLSGGGSILEVRIAAPGAEPEVESHTVGKYQWHSMSVHFLEEAHLGDFEARIAEMGDLSRVLLNLTVDGALPLHSLAEFKNVTCSRLAATLVHLELDDMELLPVPDLGDLDAIDKNGFVREAAEKLIQLTEGPDQEKARIARLALTRLFVETRTVA